MPGPYRILHVFRSPIGGLFRHVADLAREQAARGHDVGLFFDSTTENTRTASILAELSPHLSLGITRFPMQRNPGPRDVLSLRALAQQQLAVGADVLHGHGSKGGAYVRLLSDNTPCHPIRVYTPHGGSFHFKKRNLSHYAYAAIERRLSQRTDVIFFESHYVAACFKKVAGDFDGSAFVVHNGLHQHEFEPVTYEEARFDLLYIGEMLFAKGVGDLLEAVAILRRQNRRVSLLAIGSGPDASQLKAIARELGILDEVQYEGPQPIREALARSRLMVMPSRAESLPYVLLEAGAARHPLISTNVGGIPEILLPVAQELLAPGDSIALAAAIRASLEDSDEERAFRSAAIARHLQSGFSVAGMTDAVLEGYAVGLEASRSRHPQRSR